MTACGHLKPSLMCMSPLEVGSDLQQLVAHFEAVHVDLMDGHFCGSLELSPRFLSAVRSVWPGRIDAHLMLQRPGDFLSQIVAAGADTVVVHLESMARSAFRTLAEIRDLGVSVGVAVCPETPIEHVCDLLPYVDLVSVLGVDAGFAGQSMIPATLDRVAHLALLRAGSDVGFSIEVDGGVRDSTVPDLISAGADSLILGGVALFDRGCSLAESAAANRQSCRRCRGAPTVSRQETVG